MIIAIKLFNHWFSWRSVAGAMFDFSFLILTLVIALLWVSHGLPVNSDPGASFSVMFAVVMLDHQHAARLLSTDDVARIFRQTRAFHVFFVFRRAGGLRALSSSR